MSRGRVSWALVALGLVACAGTGPGGGGGGGGGGDGGGDAHGGVTSDAAIAPTVWPAFVWRHDATLVPGADGRTDLVPLPTHPALRSLLVRARPLQPLPATVCLSLDDLRDAAGSPWSATSVDADDAAAAVPDVGASSWQAGFVLGVVPGEGVAALPANALQLRVSLRACADGAPVAAADVPGGPPSLLLESVPLPAIAGRPRLPLQLASAPGVDLAAWQPALQVTLALFAAAGVDVVLPPAVALPGPLPPAAPLRLGLGLQADADAYALAIDTALGGPPPLPAVGIDLPALLLVVPCIDFLDAKGQPSRLLGHATRLPGGPRLPGVASYAVVGTSTCAAPTSADAAALGRVIAHEIGHLLGLRHRHGAAPDLMAAAPALVGAAGAFDEAQIAAISRSPLLVAP